MFGDHVQSSPKLNTRILSILWMTSLEWLWVYFMKSRSEVFTHFGVFCAEIKTQFNESEHILRSNNAKEYMSELFLFYMRQHGILHQSSCVDTTSQNRVFERKNTHLLETAWVLLFQMKVPKQFLANLVSTTCNLINSMPYSVIFPNKALFCGGTLGIWKHVLCSWCLTICYQVGSRGIEMCFLG